MGEQTFQPKTSKLPECGRYLTLKRLSFDLFVQSKYNADFQAALKLYLAIGRTTVFHPTKEYKADARKVIDQNDPEEVTSFQAKPSNLTKRKRDPTVAGRPSMGSGFSKSWGASSNSTPSETEKLVNQISTLSAPQQPAQVAGRQSKWGGIPATGPR